MKQTSEGSGDRTATHIGVHLYNREFTGFISHPCSGDGWIAVHLNTLGQGDVVMSLFLNDLATVKSLEAALATLVGGLLAYIREQEHAQGQGWQTPNEMGVPI